MNFDYTPKVRELESRLTAFMDAHVYPVKGDTAMNWRRTARGNP
jgi:hypothetical protein